MVEALKLESQDPRTPRRRRKDDAETAALLACLDVLAPLEENTRVRVLAYLGDRYAKEIERARGEA